MNSEDIRNEILTNPDLFNLLPDYKTIATTMSVGRTKLVPTEIGEGTIIAKLREISPGTEGQFLDFLVSLGGTQRDIYWMMNVIRSGRLRIDNPATRAGLVDLKNAIPTIAAQVDKLLELGVESDIITESQVKQAMLSYVNTGPDIILVQDQISFDGKYVVLDGGTYKATDLVRVKNIENSDQEVAFSAKFIAFGE
jgi:hypothetical protein